MTLRAASDLITLLRTITMANVTALTNRPVIRIAGIDDGVLFDIDCTENTVIFADGNPDTITRASGSWTTDGLKDDDILYISGSTSNDGLYTIDTVTDTVITLIISDSLAAETNTTLTITFNTGGDIDSGELIITQELSRPLSITTVMRNVNTVMTATYTYFGTSETTFKQVLEDWDRLLWAQNNTAAKTYDFNMEYDWDTNIDVSVAVITFRALKRGESSS